jgi:hypothetical protein
MEIPRFLVLILFSALGAYIAVSLPNAPSYGAGYGVQFGRWLSTHLIPITCFLIPIVAWTIWLILASYRFDRGEKDNSALNTATRR